MKSRRSGPGKFCSLAARNSFKSLEIVSDRHGQRQQLFQSLAGLFEFHGDAAAVQANPGRQIFEFLRQHLNRRFHQQLRPFQAFLLQPPQHRSQVPPPPPLVIPRVPLCQATQMRDQRIPIRQTVRAHPVRHTGRQGSAAPAADPRRAETRPSRDRRQRGEETPVDR